MTVLLVPVDNGFRGLFLMFFIASLRSFFVFPFQRALPPILANSVIVIVIIPSLPIACLLVKCYYPLMSDYEEIIVADKDKDLEGVSTGLPNLNREIGPVGGFPIGRITLLTGKYSTGKSSLALFALAQAQKMGMECLWIDTEMTFDSKHSAMCGVDNSKLKLMRQTGYAEKVFDTIERFLAGNEYEKIKPHKNAFVVLDSYSGLSIRDEVEGSAEVKDFGAKTKLLARFFRKIKTPVSMYGSVFIILAHEYPSMSQPVYMILVGGDAMAKTPSLWLDLKKKPNSYLSSSGERVGEIIVATAKKNKIGGKKYAEAELQFVFGKGWNPVADLVADALERQVITRTGNTFFYGDFKIGTKTKLDEWFKIPENEALIKEALKSKLS